MNYIMLLGAGEAIFGNAINWLKPLLMVLCLLLGIAEVVVIMMQKPQNENIGVLGGQETDSYSKKNKAKSRESILKKLTITFAVLLVVFAIFFFVILIEKK